MMRSLRFRLLLAMTVIPVIALGSVGLAMHYTNTSGITQGPTFHVVPVSRSHGGPRAATPADSDAELIPLRDPVSVVPGGRPVVFQPADGGEAFVIEADPAFVRAFERDRRATISALNKQLLIAVAAAAAAATVVAFALWRRIVRPIRSLTTAVQQMEDGSLQQRVDARSRDEIGELGRAFNSMAASLERQEGLRKTLTSDVAHELRTPLNNLSGYLDAIADGVVEPDAAVVASLQEEVAGLVRLTADLEQLALADAGQLRLHREPMRLDRVVEHAVAIARPAASARGVTLEVVVPAGLPGVEGDAVRLGQVARNLLENALRHTPPGGRIRVALAAQTGALALTVTDTGPGIPAGHLPNVFERFYRADASRSRLTGGAGLGLAIVRQLVEAHGGTIVAANEPGAGARIEVTLPALPAADRPPAPTAPSRDLAPAHHA